MNTSNRLFKLSIPSIFSHEPIKLSMNLLVKNEEDIILDNLKAHSQLGVDCFVIIDNGSDDGTWEKLQSIKDEYEVVLIRRPELDYQQTKWKSEMAKISRDQLGAHWSIANDADEFWIPKTGNIKDSLSHKGSIISCPRFNVIYKKEDFYQGSHFYNQTLRANHPIFYPKHAKAIEENLSIMLGKIQGKVIINNNGALRVRGGNHRGRHLWSFINKQATDDICVYHYPIRTYEHFINHIENRKNLLAQGKDRFGDHYKRWVRLLNEGKLNEELNRLALDETDTQVLKKYGVIREDKTAYNALSSILNPQKNIF